MPFDEFAARRLINVVREQAEAEASSPGASRGILVTVRTKHDPDCRCLCVVETRQMRFDLKVVPDAPDLGPCDCANCLVEDTLLRQAAQEAARQRRAEGVFAP